MSGKKDIASTLVKQAPNSVDIEIQSRLNALKDNEDNFDSNSFRPPSPTSPPFLPTPPPSNRPRITPTASPLSPELLLPQNIFRPVTPFAPPLSRPPPYFLGANTTQPWRFGEAVLEKNEQQFEKKIDDV